MKNLRLPIRLAAATLIAASSAFAATLTWDPTAANGAVDTGAGTWNLSNTTWTGNSGTTNTAFTNGDDAVFTGDLTSPGTQTLALGSNITAASLRADGTNGNATTINGAAGFTLTAGGLSDVAGTGLYGQNLTYAMSGAGSNFTLGADASWAVAAGKLVRLSGTGASNTIDLAGHTLTIGANNTATSLYDFNGPTIKSSVGTGQITLSGGILRFGGSGGKTVKSEGSVNVTVNTGGTLLLGVNSASGSTFAHTTSLNGGTLAAMGGLNQPVQNTGTLSVDADSKLSFSTNATLGLPAASALLFNLSGAISGTKNLTIDDSAGAGVNVVLSNDNTGFSGNWIVNNGSLQVGGAHTAGSANNTAGTVGGLGSGTVTLASGTALRFNRGNAHTVANLISGAGAVSQIATGGNVTLSALNTYTGGTTVTAGTLTIDTTGGIVVGNAGVNVSSGATLAVNGRLTLSDAISSVTNAGNIDFAVSGASIFAGNLFDGLGGNTYQLISGGIITNGSAVGIDLTGSTRWISASLDNTGKITFNAVPEPGTYGLLGAGALAAAAIVRRRRKSLGKEEAKPGAAPDAPEAE